MKEKILIGYTGSSSSGLMHTLKKRELEEQIRKLPKTSKRIKGLKGRLERVKKKLVGEACLCFRRGVQEAGRA